MSSILFHVQDEQGLPLVALIRGLNPVYGDWQGMTDWMGNFPAELAPGHYIGIISAPGYVTRTIPWNFGADGKVFIGLDPQSTPVPPPHTDDMFDLSLATIVNAPDVRGWTPAARIGQITFDDLTSRIWFDKQNGIGRWPDVRPPDWTGDVQYTWWLFRYLNGTWVGSAFIQMWYGRDGSGDDKAPDVPSLYDQHWYYSPRWTPLYGSGPIIPGEKIGMMVTSGNQRESAGPNSVMERSNTVTFPATDNGRFTW